MSRSKTNKVPASPTVRSLTLSLALGLGALVTFGCFGDDEGETDSIGDGDGDGDGDSGDEAPATGGVFVYPKYMLVDVQAIVTVDKSGLAEACDYDAVQGAYLCDTSDIVDDAATIRVERDGFEPAVRLPMVFQNSFVDLEVHLAIAGGAEGTWSMCALPGLFLDCEEACASEDHLCAPASCTTNDGEWPLATLQTYASTDCSGAPLENSVEACDFPLPAAGGGVESMRCCCGT